MLELTETTVAMAVALVGVVATVGWYVLAWYGISTLRDVRDALGRERADEHRADEQ